MSIDSKSQLRKAVFSEVEEWSIAYELEADFDELTDLTDTIVDMLSDRNVLPLDFPEALETEDEYYNDTKTYR